MENITYCKIDSNLRSVIFDGLYRCDINKYTDEHYVFDLNGKKYITSDGGIPMKWAIELDDSMLE